MESKNTSSERDLIAFAFFKELIPHYWDKKEDTPAQLKLDLLSNNWPNPAMACQDIAYHIISDKKLAKHAQRILTSTISNSPRV